MNQDNSHTVTELCSQCGKVKARYFTIPATTIPSTTGTVAGFNYPVTVTFGNEAVPTAASAFIDFCCCFNSVCSFCHGTSKLTIPGDQSYPQQIDCWYCKPRGVRPAEPNRQRNVIEK
jgi:hypothetical protein